MRALPLAPVIFANNRSGRGYLGYNGGRSPPPLGPFVGAEMPSPKRVRVLPRDLFSERVSISTAFDPLRLA